MKIVFFGSSEYSLLILKCLQKIQGFDVSAVVTKPDKATGRDKQITPNPVSRFCADNHLPLLQPEAFDDQFSDTFRSLKPDLGLCVAYGPPYFSQELIDIPKYKIVNIHPSPLPKYRGATPGPWQIINNETKSAVTFFQIDILPDHGPVITQIPFTISPDETSSSFYQKAFNLAADSLETVLTSYIQNPQSLLPQDHSKKSYFPKLSKESAKIDWSWNINKIEHFIRALDPWPIAWTEVTNSKNQILKMKIFSSTFDFRLSTLRLGTVQIEGKKPIPWAEVKDYYRIIK
ncbi:MAG: methionyl-tRNA formyltransferase [Candidatus Shapirobacteria bacterium]|jgi:methionyl-tRNA formyltransferase